MSLNRSYVSVIKLTSSKPAASAPSTSTTPAVFGAALKDISKDKEPAAKPTRGLRSDKEGKEREKEKEKEKEDKPDKAEKSDKYPLTYS
jgi:hypothetical protein